MSEELIRKLEAYEERNRVVALCLRMALALGWKAGVGEHQDVPGEDWDPEWRMLVTVDLPTGQASWHVHDSQKHLFEGLPKYDGTWDGHTTSVKYERIAQLVKEMTTESIPVERALSSMLETFVGEPLPHDLAVKP